MRKGRYGSALILAAAIAGLGIGSRTARAQFAWDPMQTPITPSGGSGTWDNTTLNWSNGTVDVAWNSGTANFGAPGGMVTIGAPVSAAAINLNAGGYTFSSSLPANVLSLSSGTLTQAAGISGINELAGPVNFSNSTVNINGGRLKLSNTLSSAANSITNTNFNVASGSMLEFDAVTGAGSLGNGNIVLNGGTLQIDPTANGLVGSFNSVFVSATTNSLNSVDFQSTPISGSPAVMTGQTAGPLPTTGINFNPSSLSPSPAFYSGGPTSAFGARFTGALNIGTAGSYTFQTDSQDTSKVYIDNQLVVLNDGNTGTSQALAGRPITLTAGLHSFRVDYADTSSENRLVLSYKGPDTGNSLTTVPASSLQTADNIVLGNNVTVTQDSTINLAGSQFTQVGLGTLSLVPSTGLTVNLNVQGDAGKSIRWSSAHLAFGETATINTSSDVFLGSVAVNSGSSTSPTTTLVKAGTGTLFLDNSVSQTFQGATILDIKGGTVDAIGAGFRTGGPRPQGPLGFIVQLDGGTLSLETSYGNPFSPWTTPLSVTKAGGTIIAKGGDVAFQLGGTGGNPLNGDLKVDTYASNTSAGTELQIVEPLTGPGNIEKIASFQPGASSNPGTLFMWASSPAWGGSIILDANTGTVEGLFNQATDQPFGPNTVFIHGGILELEVNNRATPSFTPLNSIQADGDFTISPTDGPGSFQFGGLTFTGGHILTMSPSSATSSVFFGPSFISGDTTFNVTSGTLGLGGISETSPSSLTKAGAGTLALNGSIVYTGPTNLQLGTIKMSNGRLLPTGTMNVAQGTLDLNGNSQAFDHLLSTSTGPISAGAITNSAAVPSMLVLNGNSTFTGTISDGGPGQTVALRIMAGTTTLSGLNRYSGGSYVNSGATLTSGLTLGSGGPFGTGAVTLAGGTLKLRGQQQVVPTSQGLLVQIFTSVPSKSNNTDPDYATLTSLNSHFAGAPLAVAVQSTTNGKDDFDFSNATVSNGTVTGTYTTQAPFGTSPSRSNDTTADYGYPINSYYEVRFTGYINVPQAGLATFTTTSDDGSIIWLDNNDAPVLSNNAYQPPTTDSGTYNFTTPGLHPITIGYYQGAVGEGLNVAWTPPGASSSHTLLNSETATGNLVTAPLQTYANDLVVSADSSIDVSNSLAAVMGNLSIGAQLSLTSSDTSGSPYRLTLANVILTGNSTFNVASSAGGGAGSLILGPITNTGGFTVTKTGAGTLVLTGSNSSPGLTTVQGGLLDVEGSIHPLGLNVMGNAVLGGKGTVLDGVVAIHSNATLSPSLGNTTPIGGPFTVQGNLSFDDSTAKLVLDLAGVTPGSGYDQVQFGSTVSLNGATLILNGSTETQALPAVQRIWILDGLPGSSAVNGLLSYQVQLLADGSTFTDSAGQQFMIDYNAPGDPNGTGNDILLSTTPEPTGLGLLLASAAGLLLRRRRD